MTNVAVPDTRSTPADGRGALARLDAGQRTRLIAIIAATLAIAVFLGARALHAGSTDGYVFALLAHGLAYCLAVAVVVAGGLNRRALLLILAVAALLRAIAFVVPVGLTTDGYRYIWDGRLQATGVNPYLTVPADDRLAGLRDGAIYPNINGKETYPTIYPPAAQMAFLIGTRLHDGIDGMKTLMFLAEVAIVLAVMRWLALDDLPRERVLIYAWHPLPLWEYTSAGHIDAVSTMFLLLAVLAVWRGRQGWAGAALAAVALTKYWPAYLAAALWQRWGWRMPAAGLATAVLLAVPYVAPGIYGFGFGAVPVEKLLGSLFKHLNDEGYNQEGWGFFLAYAPKHFGLWVMSGEAYARLAAAALVCLALAIALRRPVSRVLEASAPSDVAGASSLPVAERDRRAWHLIVLISAFLLAISPHYPWYYAIAVPLLARTLYLPLLWLTLAVSAIYIEIDYVWLTPYPRFRIFSIMYAGFIALVIYDHWHAKGRARL